MIAYFAMEVGIEDRIPTYSGGLGTLAGDTLYAFADLGIPAVGVTLLYRKGYVSQKLTPGGMQLDFDTVWDYKKILKPTRLYLDISFGDLDQKFTAWEYSLWGREEVKVFFLDANLPENDPEIRKLNDRLYGDDGIYRLRQEVLLGIGGYRLLKALGYNVSVYHINESHSAFLVVELLRELGSKEEVRKKCVFTTHTPVAAGHERFPVDMVKQELRKYDHMDWDKEAEDGFVNLSRLALKYSERVNAVSYKHMFVSANLFPECSKTSQSPCKIDYVTNGVYHKRWIHEEIQTLLNEYLPGWDENPILLGQVYNVPSELLLKAHMKVKSELVNLVNKLTDASFSDDVLTIGIARRVTAYKRNNLILQDLERLKYIAEHKGEIQILFAEAFRRGWTVEELYELSHIDRWFLYNLKQVVDFERKLAEGEMDEELLRQAKELGYSDIEIARLTGTTEDQIRQLRETYGIVPAFKGVDTCAGEFFAYTPYYYSTYEMPYYHLQEGAILDED